MSIPADPTGYLITYSDVEGDNDFVLFSLSKQEEVGRYPTREAAIEAAEADRSSPDGKN